MSQSPYHAKFSEVLAELEAATRKLEQLRGEISAAAARGLLEAPQAGRAPAVSRHISIAVTEAENATMRTREALRAYLSPSDAR